LAAHGDRGGERPNETLLSHSRALAASGHYRHVAAGTLRSQELSLEDALLAADASGAARIAIYPMFMADGYFTGKVLPERIAAAGLSGRCRLLAPLGLDPQLPGLMMTHAVMTASAAGLSPPQTRLLIVGHGSKLGRASLRSTERVACKLRQMQQFAWVEAAYLEETPFLDTQLTSSILTTLVLGFFSGDGMHAAEDVPGAIVGTGADAHYAGSVGRQPEISQIIHAAVRCAMGASPLA
jgi:sirohydrochlorin ferrochelatase